jgi:IS30 family transposase
VNTASHHAETLADVGPRPGDGEAQRLQVHFCDPQSPWQRGTNENTNLLLRQYFPRGADLSGYSQEQLDQVSLVLNERPRKTLGCQTPADKLQASVASTEPTALIGT